MSIAGHSILIVQPDIGPFAARLQAAVDHAGAQTVVARDVKTALHRCAEFQFSAVLLNANQREAAAHLQPRCLIYHDSEPPQEIVASLEKMLESRAAA